MGEPEKALLKYWHSLSREEGELVPRRSAINPRDIPRLLPNILIHERLGKRLIVARLTGTKIDEITGHNATGQNMYDANDPKMHPWLDRVFGAVLDTPCGLHVTGINTLEDGVQIKGSALYLPIKNNKGETTMFIGILTIKRTHSDTEGTGFAQIDAKTANFVDLGFGAPPLED